MKKCPKCGTMYSDQTLAFCLADGTVLIEDEHSAQTEVFSRGISDAPTENFFPAKTDAGNFETTDTKVRSTRDIRTSGVSPFWMIATFGLIGIVLASGLIGAILWMGSAEQSAAENAGKEMRNDSNNTEIAGSANSDLNSSAANLNVSNRSGSAPKPPAADPNAAKTYKVTGVKSDDVLYIRQIPGNLKSYVDKIPPDGRGIRIVGGSKKLGKTLWVLIEYSGKRGWVNKGYLTGE
ncbi:MAG: hypothetical protein KDB79_03395 [Acidobacteria bacterium]|nr:hypothetical protein [Acidobacteriota bacterium]